MKLVIWTEATPQIGIGHMMRMRTIALEAQKQGVECTFAGHLSSEAVQMLNGFKIIPVPAGTIDLEIVESCLTEQSFSADWLIIDTPFYKGEGLKSACWKKIMRVDDSGALPLKGIDAVLNPNYGTVAEYDSTDTDFLFGEKYLLLRQEILELKMASYSRKKDVQSILVSMGGSDPHNLTAITINALKDLSGVKVVVISGPANPRHEEYVKLVDGLDNFKLIKSVPDMGQVLLEADLVVIAAGGTLWEALYLSRPVVSFSVNDIQDGILRSLETQNTLWYLGDFRNVTYEEIRNSINKALNRTPKIKTGHCPIDGKGAERVLIYLKQEV